MGENEWVMNVNQELQNMGDSSSEMEQWKKRSIYRVPSCVTDLNKRAYKPQSVSFGPYHYGEPNLESMEENKHRALLHFLKRYKKPFECYVKAVMEVVEDLKHAYSALDQKWHQDTMGFVKMMILDGCFMLEILRAATTDDVDCDINAADADVVDDYASNDPIFSNHGKLYILPYLKRDMLMLENQLPMLLLNTLVTVTKDENNPNQHDEECVNKMVQKFCSPYSRITKMGRSLHPLDVYRRSLLWENPRHKKKPVTKSYHHLVIQEGDEIVRSATELYEAGIRFKKSKTRSLKGISFKGGVLTLPPVMVDDATESLYLNLIAFERLHVGAGNEVTSYIFFMDNIIDHAKDVSLLHSQGIIQNAIGSDKAVAKLFNSLSKDITLDPDSALDVVHKQVHNYCTKPWNEWRANLIHTYFRSPWAILSVLAAVFLFALTIIQTIYTVYPHG
ncbi:hypothetical protein HanRHA438_Chr00c16g0850561 [Helianthus annuus]|nr:hypothetical protein HanHA300_Chr08g0280511 [Helianthus annuus]KAJ0553567.1 hypothetical protein HanHA89_Chr08g0297841 [Helianthus annuus]KAJ0897909.1 hypothetical protein HanRHA438_Chr08g0350921 [Helianthus annuus]KAJ0901661.1 hypothetical protein HanPSC8_Chr08g0327931 [Helianthus annuus]KAJ0954477.1 hypothetical protein HanRHA438_Chr00c16g0850561 [Helianthus annuus]